MRLRLGLRVALVGYPLSHSVSPAMHNAAFETLGLDWRYESMPIDPSRLGEAVARIRGDGYAGANVTVPHKEKIVPLLDGLTPVAHAIGAVNTLVKRDGKLIGHNTDAAGFLADLYRHDVELSHRIVLILGAGGAARAVVAACSGMGAKMRVIARRREQAGALRSIAPIETFDTFDWTALDFVQASDGCALIVNTTPIGTSPEVEASPWPDGTPFPPEAFAYDLVYNPADTLFTQQARSGGLRAATGLGMLVEQGTLAFELWTGQTAPRDVMRRAAERQLRMTKDE